MSSSSTAQFCLMLSVAHTERRRTVSSAIQQVGDSADYFQSASILLGIGESPFNPFLPPRTDAADHKVVLWSHPLPCGSLRLPRKTHCSVCAPAQPARVLFLLLLSSHNLTSPEMLSKATKLVSYKSSALPPMIIPC